MANYTPRQQSFFPSTVSEYYKNVETHERNRKLQFTNRAPVKMREIFNNTPKEIFDMVMDMAKNGETQVLCFDKIDKKDLNKIGKKITKAVMSNKNMTIAKKMKTLHTVQKIMQTLAGKMCTNHFHKLSRKDKLAIVAKEYINAATIYMQSEDRKSMMVKGEKYPIFDIDKKRYKGAINFNSFSPLEIQTAVKKQIGTDSFQYWAIAMNLRGVVEAKVAMNTAKLINKQKSR